MSAYFEDEWYEEDDEWWYGEEIGEDTIIYYRFRSRNRLCNRLCKSAFA